MEDEAVFPRIAEINKDPAKEKHGIIRERKLEKGHRRTAVDGR